MRDIQKELFETFLLRYGFYRDEGNAKCNPEGICYTLPDDKGHGYYWMYSCDNLFALSVQDWTIYEDFYIKYPQPDYLSVSYYSSISGEELTPYKRLSCDCIKGQIGRNNLYQVIYHKNIPVRCTTIMIMPEYYQNYLQTRYPGEYEDPRQAFSSVDGSTDFPELVFLLGQVKNCRHTGIAAKLFYESKVAEAISLIVHKTKATGPAAPPSYVPQQDLDRLASVREYLNDHFAFNIQLTALSKIACMSPTKLKYTFKKVYQCTVFEYIHAKRMSHAEHLLTNTDLNIQQIAQTVGYQKASNFSSAFRKNTGLLPHEYRKFTRTQSPIFSY
jgi:AraC-like DNA-binding protein